jgi:hydroxyethylthiazole kinase-like uncharacterized protein yjeF
MRDAEARAFVAGIAPAVLMETAGAALARATLPYVPKGGSCLVLVGPGQNGGDGLCAARHLRAHGVRMTIWLLADRGKLRGDARAQLGYLQGADGVLWCAADETPQGTYDAAIDAIFGISLHGDLRGTPLRAVQYLADRSIPVISADLPSGVRADTGEIAGAAVRATRTVALGALKPGHIFLPGRTYAGEVSLEPLGLLPEGTNDLPLRLLRHVPDGPTAGPEAPKQAYGRALIVAGCEAYPGAAWLAARGAVRGGAGLTVLASVPDVLMHPGAMPEVILQHLRQDTEGGIDPADVTQELAASAQAVAVGPGLGRLAELAEWRRAIIALRRPLVLDADGLRPFAGRPEDLARRNAPTVLTPHIGEASRLLGREIAGAPHERLAAAVELAQRSGAVTLLKGQPTFIATPYGRVGIVDMGGPELATGGTGDVLTGLIAAQLAQGMPARIAAERAAVAHARAGATLRRIAPRGHLASEVADAAAQALGGEG